MDLFQVGLAGVGCQVSGVGCRCRVSSAVYCVSIQVMGLFPVGLTYLTCRMSYSEVHTLHPLHPTIRTTSHFTPTLLFIPSPLHALHLSSALHSIYLPILPSTPYCPYTQTRYHHRIFPSTPTHPTHQHPLQPYTPFNLLLPLHTDKIALPYPLFNP